MKKETQPPSETTENRNRRIKLVEGLQAADAMELESAEKILREEMQDELEHAVRIGEPLKVIGGIVPGSMFMSRSQGRLQPTSNTTDLVSISEGVIEAEENVVQFYRLLIREADGFDYPTQDLLIDLLADEEEHRRVFAGFLRGMKEPATAEEVPDEPLVFARTA